MDDKHDNINDDATLKAEAENAAAIQDLPLTSDDTDDVRGGARSDIDAGIKVAVDR